MGVNLRGHAVGGPAGVADAAGAGQSTTIVSLLRQILKTACGLHHFRQLTSVPDSQSGGIIATIFQLAQAVQQNGRSLFSACKSNNTAHRQPSFPALMGAAKKFCGTL